MRGDIAFRARYFDFLCIILFVGIEVALFVVVVSEAAFLGAATG